MTSIVRMAAVLPLFAAALAAAGAQTTAPEEPDVRLVYESDTRAYYRPCG